MGEEKVDTYQDMRYFSWSILTSPIMHWDSCCSPNQKLPHPSCSIQIKTGIQVYYSLHGSSIVQKRSEYTNVGDEDDDDYAGYDESRLDFRVHCCSFGFHGEAQVLILHKMKDETSMYKKLPSRKLKNGQTCSRKKSFATGLFTQYLG